MNQLAENLTPRVFLIEANQRYNLDQLTQFGTQHILCQEREVNPFHTDRTVELIRQRLDEVKFDNEIDYICMTGQNLKIAIFLAVVASDYGSVRVLMFDAVQNSYKECKFDVTFEDEEVAANTT